GAGVPRVAGGDLWAPAAEAVDVGPARDERGQGAGEGIDVAGWDEQGGVAGDLGHRCPLGRDERRAARPGLEGGPAGAVRARGMTCTAACGLRWARRRSAVTALTHTSASARSAATRMARRKNGTLARSCHSGWSKNVMSWMVTTLGTFARCGIV